MKASSFATAVQIPLQIGADLFIKKDAKKALINASTLIVSIALNENFETSIPAGLFSTAAFALELKNQSAKDLAVDSGVALTAIGICYLIKK
jgi:hypothetical protein